MELSGEELIERQLDLRRKINRVVENMNKLGKAQITEAVIETRIEMLHKLWNEFDGKNDLLIFRHKDVLKLNKYQDNIAELVQEEYLNQKAALKEHFHRLGGKASKLTIASPSGAENSSHRHNTLPRMQIPPFSGRYEDWPSFKDLFQSIIGKDERLSDVERLNYLKVSLTGGASALIKDLSTTSDNYSRAWKTLTDHYEKKRVLVRSCLAKFAAVKKPQRGTNKELQKLINCIATTVSSLESLGRPIRSSEDWFVYCTVEKLDDRTRAKWEEAITTSNDPPSYDTLWTFLERRLQTLDVLTPAEENEQKSNSIEKSHQPVSRSVRANHAEKRSVKAKCVL